MGYFIDEFQEQTWNDKYRYKNETYEEYCYRIAYNIFKKDEEEVFRTELYDRLLNVMVLFGGRINSNIGIEEDGLTLFNCFIEPIPLKDADSLESIFDVITKYALTLKTEGGVGFCCNFLRPSKTLIRKIGVTTPGAIKFLEIFDKVSDVITSGDVSKEESKQGTPFKNTIRKGATMVTMSICHPDIKEFINAKTSPNRLTKMNMSVLITDAFMQAVDEDVSWDLWFPDINFEKYSSEWNGDFEKWAEKGYPYVVYETLKATDLWDLLLFNTYNRNEPGIIFIDTVRKMDNLWYLEHSSIMGPNPCNEIFGSTGVVEYDNELELIGDVCDLGSINITKFYSMEHDVFDYCGFLEAAALLVRALDNIIDISNYPLELYRIGAELKRKIGIGIAGVGSLMMMMGIEYGGEECVKFLDDLLVRFMNTLYQTSAKLSEEKGPFKIYDEKMLEGGYVKHNSVLYESTMKLIRKHGIRNSALSAIAPNGSLSIVAGNISGGLEPVFAKEFYRWSRVEGQSCSFVYPNVHKGEWFETDYFKEDTVADETVLMSIDGKYRIDKNTGLCRRILLMDYGYKIAKERSKSLKGAMELPIENHLSVLKSFSVIDQSMSKTINLSNDTSFDEFKQVYSTLHKYGVKGCTTYREGTSVCILEVDKQEKTVKEQQEEFLDVFKNQRNEDIIVQDVKLPAEYPAKGYILKSEGKKWYVHVAFKDESLHKPFAIFVNTNNKEDNVLTFNAIDKLEELALEEGLSASMLEIVKKKYSYQKNPVKVCRMLGFLLRHNVKVINIVKILDGVEDAIPGTFIFRIKKFLSQFVQDHALQKPCPECGKKTLVYTEGCTKCTECGASKCE